MGDGGWAGADAEMFQWEGDGWVFKTEETIRTSLSQRIAKVFSVLIKCFGLFLVCSWCGFVGLLLACSRFVLGLFLVCSWLVLGFFFASYRFLANAKINSCFKSSVLCEGLAKIYEFGAPDVVGGGKRSETAWVCERVGKAGLPNSRLSYDTYITTI